MSTEKLLFVTDDTGKKNEMAISLLSEEDNFLTRALIKNAESRRRYYSNKLLSEPLQVIESHVRLQAGESWLLTG